MPAYDSSRTALPIRDQLLKHFPKGVYGLTIVSDPDDLLMSEDVLHELATWEFTLIMEEDPVLLRARVEQLRPWAPGKQLVILTRNHLNTIPFDLWQQAHKVPLSLHGLFPHLAYPVLKDVSPYLRSRLASVPAPERALGEIATIDWVLVHGFDFNPGDVYPVSSLVSWLNSYHQLGYVLTDRLRQRLISRAALIPDLQDMDIRSLLTDPKSFEEFMSEQWQGFVRSSARIEESAAQYILDFAGSRELQDSVAGFVRTGAIEPVIISDPATMPHWARPALVAETDDSRVARSELLIQWVNEHLGEPSGLGTWTEWKNFATNWAELTVLRDSGPNLSRLSPVLAELEAILDERFLAWLQGSYTSLAVSSLPVPHHVHHIPRWLAHRRESSLNRKIALIIMDGMSLADWTTIAPIWHRRNPSWSIVSNHVMAQLPTITAVSRQAMISGRRPSQFAASITSNTQEPRLWKQFWSNNGIPETDVEYKRISLDQPDIAPVTSHRTRVACWIVNDIDEIVHGATLGTRDVMSSIQIWLNERFPTLEAGIQQMLEAGFDVFIASDHGHVEATGTGNLSEGAAVESRGKRARTYREELLARRACETMGSTIIWGNDGLLPDDFWALLPKARDAFTTPDDTVVTHGGATIDEVIVPLITITAG